METKDQDRAPSLRVRLVQREASIDPEVNVRNLDEVAKLTGDADLVILPEADARDFGKPGGDLRPYAESLDGRYPKRLRELAGDAVVVAGMFESRPDELPPYNTLVATGGGTELAYRKIHLYDSFGIRESDQLTAGPITPAMIEVAGVPVGLMTCYDLRFPELARALSAAGAEVLVIPAAWVAGERKLDHWRTLVRARAIENVCWVLAVGQCGPRYTGHSLVVDPYGEVVAEAGDDDVVLDQVIDLGLVATARRQNPSLDNRRFGPGID